MHHRFDVLMPVHKGLRHALSGLCFRAGSMDVSDENEVQSFADEFGRIVTILESHSHDEDAHMHHLYEQFAPETAAKLEQEHTVLDETIHRLQQRIETVRQASPAEQRKEIWYEVNRKLTQFTADYFQHLQREENEGAEALWNHLTDDQLKEVSVKIRSSIPPSTMMIFLHYMMPALNFEERFGILNDMRQFAPPEAYQAVRALAQSRLAPGDWEALNAKLESMSKVS
ncbi:hemerythrin domain-containing protein [Paenibacillus sp.]|uniref:hemerythrin domain-containing protein n=1 Tax=Paenibacillus sp. TaxID=58172 RepID=UPI002D2B52DD|nr:hemerythrin domain-containing protein [Paenibacillus sp.]HZG56127.1 hemerythrin domain-containing protein [Paenibacillus sp.]